MNSALYGMVLFVFRCGEKALGSSKFFPQADSASRKTRCTQSETRLDICLFLNYLLQLFLGLGDSDFRQMGLKYSKGYGAARACAAPCVTDWRA